MIQLFSRIFAPSSARPSNRRRFPLQLSTSKTFSTYRACRLRMRKPCDSVFSFFYLARRSKMTFESTNGCSLGIVPFSSLRILPIQISMSGTPAETMLIRPTSSGLNAFLSSQMIQAAVPVPRSPLQQGRLERRRQKPRVTTRADPNSLPQIPLDNGFLIVAVSVSALAGTLRGERS